MILYSSIAVIASLPATNELKLLVLKFNFNMSRFHLHFL